MRIAIVAGEPSGDVLAAGLIAQIKKRVPDAHFYGIGGEQMQAQGFEALYPMDSIALMGVESVLKDLRNILNIRRTLLKVILADKPDCFIGVDVPDFNLSLEKNIKANGIKVVHYVSPSVWAWRGYRIRKIKHAIDHMLTLFPFEKKYYDQHAIPATFIGHPTADKAIAIREQANTQAREHTIALLPGSRRAEVSSLLPIMLDAARRIHTRYPGTQFILPFASEQLKNQYTAMIEQSALPIEVSLQQSGEALVRAKLSIVASGTAALEAMIYGSVMVVVYKLGWISYLMYSLFKHVEHFSLPNQLLIQAEIPELSQKQVTAENIYQQTCKFLDDPARMLRLEQEFAQVSQTLHKNTDVCAAQAVLKLLEPSINAAS